MPKKKTTKRAKAPRRSKVQATKTTKAPAQGKEKRLSQLDAAAQVLREAARPMSTGEMIEAMATQGLWTSPGGKTPAATLHAAIGREIAKKGAAARFAKTVERGKFIKA